MKDEEQPFRLRPRKPRIGRPNEKKVWAAAYLFLSGALRLARGVRRGAARSRSKTTRQSQVYLQRAAVRITYSSNRGAGQWRAHGRYLARESAARARFAGFDRTNDLIDVARKLDEWQRANDERLWKIIVSPEFGDRMDLKRLTRELSDRMEIDLRTRLEWVAVVHSNTDHKHVHMALRGRRDDGQPLLLEREYIKHGIRRHVEELCTKQLGYRTPLDAEEALRREVAPARITSLDRTIGRDNPRDGNSESFTVARPEPKRMLEHFLVARLNRLVQMGLAEPIGPLSWTVRTDFENVLRSMQKAADRQRTLVDHGLPVSDKRLPFEVLDHRALTSIAGRILVHGEDEALGTRYMVVEGIDAKLHLLPCTYELDQARSQRKLRPGSFVIVRKRFEDGRPLLGVKDHGNAEALLKNKEQLEKAAKGLCHGKLPENAWEGWLGRYYGALREAIKDRNLGDSRGRA